MDQGGRVYLSIKVSRGGTEPVWLPSFLERRIAPGHCVFYCTFAGGAFDIEAIHPLDHQKAAGYVDRHVRNHLEDRWVSMKDGYKLFAVKRLTREQYLERLYKICPPKG